jgi:hypothetical protein
MKASSLSTSPQTDVSDDRAGLACFMLVDLDRPDARIEEQAGNYASVVANRTHIRRDTECGGKHADAIHAEIGDLPTDRGPSSEMQ